MVYNSAKRPIAVYDANTDVTRRLWKTLKTLNGVWQRDEADAGDSDATMYAIHTDHLGTPQVVTDEQQQVVWQAETNPFGLAKITYAARSASRMASDQKFELHLRLPGQSMMTKPGCTITITGITIPIWDDIRRRIHWAQGRHESVCVCVK
jgi:hypothetical protein